jgi:hypothetical protein
MTLLEIAREVRAFRDQEIKARPGWNPKDEYLVQTFGMGQIMHRGSLHGLGKVLKQASLSGAMEGPYFNDLRPALVGKDLHHVCLAVMSFLSDRGFPIFGIEKNCDPWERLAAAFEAISKTAQKPEKTLTHRQKRILEILGSLKPMERLQAKEIHKKLVAPVRNDCTVETLMRHDIPRLKKLGFIKHERGRGYYASDRRAGRA